MSTTFELVYAVILFLAIYIQVFFLLLFFEHKKKISPKNITPTLAESEKLSVTFLLPAWNESKTVCGTIQSILTVDYPKDKLHIIVIDDGSKDDTWEILQQYKDHSQITLIHKENGGKFTALNAALPYVKTDLVASFDADTKIEPNALHKAVPHFVHDPELMALGGTVLIDHPKSFAQKAQEIEYQTFSFTKKMLGFAGAVLVVPGAFAMFRKEVFDKVGGYRHAYLLEDAELTMRLHSHGFKIDHCHDAIVWTKGPTTVKGLFKQRLRWSYGFIKNAVDYRYMFLNHKYGNFGMFTLPMSVAAYVLLVFIFSYSVYKVSIALIATIQKIILVGWGGFEFGRWDPFFFDTKATTIMSLFIYTAIITGFFLGRYISRIKKKNFHNIPYFIVVYGYIAPFWVMKSIYSWIFGKKVTWR